MDWNRSPIQWKGNYTSQWAEAGTMPVVKQFVGDFVTNSGLSVGSCLPCSDIAVSCQRSLDCSPLVGGILVRECFAPSWKHDIRIATPGAYQGHGDLQ